MVQDEHQHPGANSGSEAKRKVKKSKGCCTHLLAFLLVGHVAQKGLVETPGPEKGGVDEIRSAAASARA